MRDSVESERKRRVLSLLKAANESGGAFPTAAELEAMTQGHERRRASRKRLIPIMGFISAGFPGSGDAPDAKSVAVDAGVLKLKPSARAFALRVRGDSMTGAGILDGDLVIVEAREPKVGDVVAALIDGEITLKRLVSEDGRLFLKAEQPGYPDLVPLRELAVQGVVRSVVSGDGSSVI